MDPLGQWCDCCIRCIVKFTPHVAPIIDQTSVFKTLRKRQLDDRALKELLLERRLDKVLDWLIHTRKMDEDSWTKFQRGLSTWVDLQNCICCHVAFGWFNRRHHCRICGEAVCGDLVKGCSMVVPLGMLFEMMVVDKDDVKEAEKEKVRRILEGDRFGLRVCKECKRHVLNKKVFYMDKVNDKGEMFRFFKVWKLVEKKLQGEDLTVIENNVQNKLYVEYFNKLDKLIKEIDLYVGGGGCKNDEVRILNSLKSVVIKYIKENLPILRKSQNTKLENERMKLQMMIDNKPKLSKREIREKREKLMVLNEQKFLVGEMYETFKKQRRFDDLKTLDSNLLDIEREIGELNLELGDEAFTV